MSSRVRTSQARRTAIRSSASRTSRISARRSAEIAETISCRLGPGVRNPSCLSRSSACLTGVLETPSASASVPSASTLPAGKCPRMIPERRSSYVRSASVSEPRRSGLSADELDALGGWGGCRLGPGGH